MNLQASGRRSYSIHYTLFVLLSGYVFEEFRIIKTSYEHLTLPDRAPEGVDTRSSPTVQTTRHIGIILTSFAIFDSVGPELARRPPQDVRRPRSEVRPCSPDLSERSYYFAAVAGLCRPINSTSNSFVSPARSAAILTLSPAFQRKAVSQ